MKRRRDITTFSLSFLDCICCGFGAIILLFVLSKAGEPKVLEAVREDLSGLVAKLQEELFDLRGETLVLNRELQGKKEQLSEEKKKLARLQGDWSEIEGEFSASASDAEVQNTIEGQLARARQDLTEEMRRLLAQVPVRRKDNPVGGIPVDSEYIIFIIDTSGSMQQFAWPLMIRKVRETLDIYPRVKGIQVMNDMGNYMFPQYAGRWIPDSGGRRKAILSALTTWRAFSNSSPVEGITAAINTFYDKNKKISLYVFGDEFSGLSMLPVIHTVERINRVDAAGNRRVRIHAVGFPVMIQDRPGYPVGPTGERFATLMRVLCEENGGAFVGLNTLTP